MKAKSSNETRLYIKSITSCAPKAISDAFKNAAWTNACRVLGKLPAFPCLSYFIVVFGGKLNGKRVPARPSAACVAKFVASRPILPPANAKRSPTSSCARGIRPKEPIIALWRTAASPRVAKADTGLPTSTGEFGPTVPIW